MSRRAPLAAGEPRHLLPHQRAGRLVEPPPPPSLALCSFVLHIYRARVVRQDQRRRTYPFRSRRRSGPSRSDHTGLIHPDCSVKSVPQGPQAARLCRAKSKPDGGDKCLHGPPPAEPHHPATPYPRALAPLASAIRPRMRRPGPAGSALCRKRLRCQCVCPACLRACLRACQCARLFCRMRLSACPACLQTEAATAMALSCGKACTE